MDDRRPPLDGIFRAFGVAATVTAPNADPITTTVIRGDVGAELAQGPGGVVVPTSERREIVTIRRDQVPSAPRDTTIAIGDERYVVDGEHSRDDEVVHLNIRPAVPGDVVLT